MIASLVGYSDQLYFSRVFRKSMGMSPAEYRKCTPSETLTQAVDCIVMDDTEKVLYKPVLPVKNTKISFESLYLVTT